MRDRARELEGAGLRPSAQRLAILGYLRSTKAHPSAETVWQALLPSMPTLSRTTVHNTLALLAEAGLAQAIHLDEEELRWDGDTAEHGHFRCRRCGRIWDFPVPARRAGPRLPAGFSVDLVQLYCRGTCPDCASARKGKPAAASRTQGQQDERT